MKMRAPEGTSSASVESTTYEPDADGHVEVENGEHIPHLERHGFVQVADPEGDTHSDPVDEVGECPDFTKFVNRRALVDWLVTHGVDGADENTKRAELEAACLAQYEKVAAGEAHRIQPEAAETETDEEKAEDDIVAEADLEDAAK